MTLLAFRVVHALTLASVILALASCATRQTSAPEVANTPHPKVTIVENQAFSEDTMYALLVAELALVREHYDVGSGNYYHQALDTEDVNVTARATQIARILGKHEEALELSEQWHRLDPSNREAQLVLVSEYIHVGRFDDAFDTASALLESGDVGGFEDIAVEAVASNSDETDELTLRYRELSREHPENAELLVGSSILEQAGGNLDRALSAAIRAVNLEPDNPRLVYQEYRVLVEMGMEQEALETYAKLVELEPDNIRIRSRFARMLIKHDLEAARDQYAELFRQTPDNYDVRLNLGLLQHELGEIDEAAQHFNALVSANKHTDISHFNLGEIARDKGDEAGALSHFLNVKGGSRFVDSVSSAANIILRQDGFESALAFLSARRQNAPSENDVSRIYSIEADTLSREGHIARAESKYNEAIERFPDDISLRYSRAMHFSLLEEPDAAEKDFLKVLEQAPENAATLNALGYTLLVQTNRLDEAEMFIRKAHRISPNEPAIIDSLGWLEFKLGNVDRAQDLLEQAFSSLTDDEVAAHLGEVLWIQGHASQARKVWLKGLEYRPSGSAIPKTLERLKLHELLEELTHKAEQR